MTGRMGNLMNAQEMHEERHWERMARFIPPETDRIGWDAHGAACT